MEEAALIISVFSLLAVCAGLAWNEFRWRSERRSEVHVMALHQGMGMDVYSADAVQVEQVIALRVFNRGERSEHVMWTGLESPTGEPLVDDRPKAAKMVDDPPPQARELPSRGQIATQFKIPADAIAAGFIGYAVLGTGRRVYSPPAGPEHGLGEIQAEIRNAISRADPDD